MSTDPPRVISRGRARVLGLEVKVKLESCITPRRAGNLQDSDERRARSRQQAHCCACGRPRGEPRPGGHWLRGEEGRVHYGLSPSRVARRGGPRLRGGVGATRPAGGGRVRHGRDGRVVARDGEDARVPHGPGRTGTTSGTTATGAPRIQARAGQDSQGDEGGHEAPVDGLRLPRVHERVDQERRDAQRESGLEDDEQHRVRPNDHEQDEHHVQRRPAEDEGARDAQQHLGGLVATQLGAARRRGRRHEHGVVAARGERLDLWHAHAEARSSEKEKALWRISFYFYCSCIESSRQHLLAPMPPAR